MIIYTLLLIILACLEIAIIFLILIQILAALNTDAPFVSVPENTLEEIVQSFDLDEKSTLFDLGCGNAEVLLLSQNKYPQINSVGIEKNLLAWIIAKFNTRKHRKIQIIYGDIFNTNLLQATHIYLYVYPKVITKLFPLIKKQCKPGTKIISCDFEIDGILPDKVVEIKNTSPEKKRGKKIFLYKI